MRIAFRVDASARIGVGHLTRCLTLAARFKALGAHVVFVCVKSDQYSYAQLLQLAYRVIFLEDIRRPRESVTDYRLPEVKWTPHDQEIDASALTKALGSSPLYDWLIVDHYGLNIFWERAVRVITKRLMVIDDLANREHDCDLLLDQGCLGDNEQRYAPLVTNNCRLALGPGYALLSQEYISLRRERLRHSGSVSARRKILVSFGGTDQKALYEFVIQALFCPMIAEIHWVLR